MPSRVDRQNFAKGLNIYKPKGCKSCNNFGFRGRIGIFEFLEAGSKFEEVILEEASEVALKKLGESQGMVKMQEDGILKALLGITTFEEVEEITGPIEW